MPFTPFAQVEYVLDKVLAEPRPPIQIAFLQGAIPLQTGACFEKLLGALRGPQQVHLVGQHEQGHGANDRVL